MAGPQSPYEYVVERDLSGSSGPTIKLVRYEHKHTLFGRDRRRDGRVLFQRTFRPIGVLDQLETYAALLERVARHSNQGTFGSFVENESEGGHVEVTLYERWFDGTRLHCDVLARRAFDAGDENSLVESAEFRAEIEQWAEEQNDRREAWYLSAASDAEWRAEQTADRTAAADALAEILARRG